MKEERMDANLIKENYYALLIAIFKNKSISESLRLMGLTEGKVTSKENV